jgi:hypothetical protein
MMPDHPLALPLSQCGLDISYYRRNGVTIVPPPGFARRHRLWCAACGLAYRTRLTAAGFAADAEGPTIRAASFAVTLDPEEAAGTHTGINEAKAALQALVDDVASAIKSAGEQSDSSSAPAGILAAGPRLIKHAHILNLRLDAISSSIDDLRRAADARSSALAALDAAVGKARYVMETVVRRTDDERAMRAGEIAQARNRVDRTLLLATSLACIFGLALALVVGLSITRPIGRLAHAMRVVSDGTLDYDVPDTAA